MSFSGSFYKVPCHCTSPQVAKASDVGLPLYYVNIVIAGYWYQRPPELYDAYGRPMTIVSFSGNFGNLSYHYQVYTKNVLGNVALTKENMQRELCNTLVFMVETWDDIIPQIYHADSSIQFNVKRLSREGGKTLWYVQGCK